MSEVDTKIRNFNQKKLGKNGKAKRSKLLDTLRRLQDVETTIYFPFLNILVLLTLGLTLPQCTRTKTIERVIVQTPTTSPTTSTVPTSPSQEGVARGGGGFVSENSQHLLLRAQSELVRTLEHVSPGVFKSLPDGWSAHDIAQVIAAIEYKSEMRVFRHGKELMFDYHRNTTGQGPLKGTVLALKPYFDSYANFAIKVQDPLELSTTIKDLQLKMLHEVAHLIFSHDNPQSKLSLDLIEKEAESFALQTLKSFESDRVLCRAIDTEEKLSPLLSNRLFSSHLWPLVVLKSTSTLEGGDAESTVTTPPSLSRNQTLRISSSLFNSEIREINKFYFIFDKKTSVVIFLPRTSAFPINEEKSKLKLVSDQELWALSANHLKESYENIIPSTRTVFGKDSPSNDPFNELKESIPRWSTVYQSSTDVSYPQPLTTSIELLDINFSAWGTESWVDQTQLTRNAKLNIKLRRENLSNDMTQATLSFDARKTSSYTEWLKLPVCTNSLEQETTTTSMGAPPALWSQTQESQKQQPPKCRAALSAEISSKQQNFPTQLSMKFECKDFYEQVRASNRF